MANFYEPLMRTRFTDMTAPLFTSQGTKCQDFEMRFMDCMEAYGKKLGQTKCEDLKADLIECTYAFKQTMRVRAMNEERARQYKAGERTKENYYGPNPTPDSF